MQGRFDSEEANKEEAWSRGVGSGHAQHGALTQGWQGTSDGFTLASGWIKIRLWQDAGGRAGGREAR